LEKGRLLNVRTHCAAADWTIAVDAKPSAAAAAKTAAVAAAASLPLLIYSRCSLLIIIRRLPLLCGFRFFVFKLFSTSTFCSILPHTTVCRLNIHITRPTNSSAARNKFTYLLTYLIF